MGSPRGVPDIDRAARRTPAGIAPHKNADAALVWQSTAALEHPAVEAQ
jgi:hypothetical protein